MNGNIIWDKISTLDLYMAEGSALTGAVLCDSTYDGSGYAKLYIDESSSWIVTGNSTLSSLCAAGSIKDTDGKTVSVIKSDGTVLVHGDSEYTVTTDEYADTADMSGMGTYTDWSEYKVDKPSYFESSSSTGSTGSTGSGSSGSSSSGSAGSSESGTSPDNSDSPVKNEEKTDLFDDVKSGEWYYDAVKYMREKGFMKGTSDNEFSPGMPITRAMFVTILYRIENEPEVNIGNVFSDVGENEYYSDAVSWARENHIVSGVSDIEFAPDNKITREQIAAMIYRYAEHKGAVAKDTERISLDYADISEISDYAAEAVEYCKEKGIMQGKDNNSFAPKDNTTRAETAAVLQRFLEN